MRKQDHLVRLIASLEPNEKRYFRLFSGLQPGEKRYIKLFEALETKDKYEANELCAELGVAPAQLADEKHYLTQTLLQVLRNYDQEATELNILKNNLENAQSLVSRRMFGFALDLIEKTMARAWELEAFEIIDTLLIQRSSCWQNLGSFPEKDDTVELHKRAVEKVNEVIELMQLRSNARQLEVNGAAPGRFKKVIEHPLVKCNIEKLKSIRAKSLRYEALSHYYSAQVDADALLKLARDERKLYLKNPQIKIINPIVYLTNISRLASGETDFEIRQQRVGELQGELRNPEIRISAQRRESMQWSASLISLWNLRYLLKFKEALTIAENAYAARQSRTEYERFSVTFEYALILLHTGNVALAADKIDELLRYKSDVRLNMQPFVRLLHVMVQLELGNYLIIPSIIKAARFWLKQRQSGHQEVSLFLKHAGLIANAPVNKMDAWEAFRSDIDGGNLPTVTRLLQLDVWIKHIMQGQPRSKRT